MGLLRVNKKRVWAAGQAVPKGARDKDGECKTPLLVRI
jgi:hypothetical protein